MTKDDTYQKLLRAQLSHHKNKMTRNFESYQGLLLLYFELLGTLEGNPLFKAHLDRAYALICQLR